MRAITMRGLTRRPAPESLAVTHPRVKDRCPMTMTTFQTFAAFTGTFLVVSLFGLSLAASVSAQPARLPLLSHRTPAHASAIAEVVWTWSGNTHTKGMPQVAAGATANVVHSNVTALPITDTGAATDLANNAVFPKPLHTPQA